MADYRPSAPFNVPMRLLVPTYATVSGVRKKTFPSASSGPIFYGSFKTYGGTEHDVNGVFAIEDTAIVETWFRPDIKSECAIALANTGEIYEIKGSPENINLRNQYLRFTVSRVKGGA